MKCNKQRCKVGAGAALTCNRTVDVVLLIDGSGSLGKKGWDAEMKAAQFFVDAFSASPKANMAVLLYSGPRTYNKLMKYDKIYNIFTFSKDLVPK